jgi:hypothetical protein
MIPATTTDKISSEQSPSQLEFVVSCYCEHIPVGIDIWRLQGDSQGLKRCVGGKEPVPHDLA